MVAGKAPAPPAAVRIRVTAAEPAAATEKHGNDARSITVPTPPAVISAGGNHRRSVRRYSHFTRSSPS